MLPQHGKIDCTLCHGNEGKPQLHPAWRIRNDPGAWGSSDPEYLVLGFSKGSTQANIYGRGRFEDIAFAGMRPRLQRSLRHFGALAADESLSQAIADPNGRFAFGSLIRCSVARWDARSGAYTCSGALIEKSFGEIPEVLKSCARRFLTGLPKRLHTVFLLGNADGYVRRCHELLEALYTESFEPVNDVAVRAGGKLWLSIAHPSGSNGHFERWLTGAADAGGCKRVLVEQALGMVANPVPASQGNPVSLPAPAAVAHGQSAPARESSSAGAVGSLGPERAEAILAERFERTAQPTKYIAGFRTRRGRELALERNRVGVQLWIETLGRGLPDIVILNRNSPGQPYATGQSRNSNLNAKNAPRLMQGHPAFYIKVADEGALQRFLDWYETA